jgi:hypothetical protein
MLLQGLAALVDGDRFLEVDLSLLEALHDALELGQGLLEGQAGDVGRFGRGRRCRGHGRSFHDRIYGASHRN